MLTRHRLSILVLPRDPDAAPALAHRALLAWRELGFVTESGGPGPNALLDGGFRRAGAEARATPCFLSNRVGGFRVACPVDGRVVVPDFNRAMERWRAGGPRRLACPCGADHDLDALRFAPEAGFARGWLVIEEVDGVEIDPAALSAAREAFGDVRILLIRG